MGIDDLRCIIGRSLIRKLVKTYVKGTDLYLIGTIASIETRNH